MVGKVRWSQLPIVSTALLLREEGAPSRSSTSTSSGQRFCSTHRSRGTAGRNSARSHPSTRACPLVPTPHRNTTRSSGGGDNVVFGALLQIARALPCTHLAADLVKPSPALSLAPPSFSCHLDLASQIAGNAPVDDELDFDPVCPPCRAIKSRQSVPSRRILTKNFAIRPIRTSDIWQTRTPSSRTR